MNIKLTLGERLKDLRVERHLKLETLAEQTGLSKSALSKYESDDVTDLSIYAVTTLAEFYGVTTDYLLGVTDNKKRPDAVLSDLSLIHICFAHRVFGFPHFRSGGRSMFCFQRFLPDCSSVFSQNHLSSLFLPLYSLSLIHIYFPLILLETIMPLLQPWQPS